MAKSKVVARRTVSRGPPRWVTAGALGLIILLLHGACAAHAPRGILVEASDSRYATERGLETAAVFDVSTVEPGAGTTRPVPIDKAEYRHGVARLVHGLRLSGTSREAARQLLEMGQELHALESVSMAGVWEAEAYRGQIYSMLPVSQTGPIALIPEAEATIREEYTRWCERQGGGDCLGLLDDGPYLRADDRRTLALALAFGSVLDETREALARELSPRAVMASLVWAVALYLGMWLVAEPATKGVAAAFTVLLVAWLGIDTVWGLMDGWVLLATQAHEASTFEELRTAGAGFSKVMGTDAARTLLLAVTALMGRTVGEVAGMVRSLPSYPLARAQFEAQGLGGWVLVELGRVHTVVASGEGALAVVVSPEASVAGAMLSRNSAASASPVSGRPGVTEVYRHRGGNRQVELSNGQRWHLPRGTSLDDIPPSDPLGDALQAAAREAAVKWGPHRLSDKARRTIERMRQQGASHRAQLLERRARGQWVEAEVRRRFGHLSWNPRGVDITGPSGQTYHYEILSGTDSNFELHGRRMFSIFFRMIAF